MAKVKEFFREQKAFCSHALVWPSDKKTLNKTAVVVAVVVIAAGIMIGADTLYGLLLSLII